MISTEYVSYSNLLTKSIILLGRTSKMIFYQCHLLSDLFQLIVIQSNLLKIMPEYSMDKFWDLCKIISTGTD